MSEKMHSGTICCSGRGRACTGKHSGVNVYGARPGNAQPLNENLA